MKRPFNLGIHSPSFSIFFRILSVGIVFTGCMVLLGCVNPKPYVRTVDKVPKAFERKSAEAVFYLKESVGEANREVSSYSLYYLGRYYLLFLSNKSKDIVGFDDSDAFGDDLEQFFEEHYFSETSIGLPAKNIILEAIGYGLLTRPRVADFFERVFAEEMDHFALAYALIVSGQGLKKWHENLKKPVPGQLLIDNAKQQAETEKLNQRLESLAHLLFPACMSGLSSPSSLVFQSAVDCMSILEAISENQRFKVKDLQQVPQAENLTENPLRQLWFAHSKNMHSEN